MMRRESAIKLISYSAGLLCIGIVTAHNSPTWAQIVPDNTLGNANSTITRNIEINGKMSDRIDGGAIAGTNLFHSFQQFNIDAGRGAYFANPQSITNIFSRVTGNLSSNISGTLGVLGNANLFFLNPNGLVFGKEASLDLKGSFLASTANRIKFADGTEFNTSPQTQVSPLLTVSIPIGLGFGNHSSPILMQGVGSVRNPFGDLLNKDDGLQIDRDQTLALVGGDLTIAGGILSSDGGRVELGSLGAGSQVKLVSDRSGFTLDYGDTNAFRDIQMIEQAAIDVSSEASGNVQVRGRNITLSGGSQIENNTLGSGSDRTLVVKASESLLLTGATSDRQSLSALFAVVLPDATGQGGDLTVAAKHLRLENGAQISVANFQGNGNAGNLTAIANDIELVAQAGDPANSGLFATVLGQDSSGAGGNIIVTTDRLQVLGGASISASTFGQGNAGNLSIKAAKSILLTGLTDGSRLEGGLFAQVGGDAKGKGGDINIVTERLELNNTASIAVKDFSGSVGAGSLRISAPFILVDGRSEINATTGAGENGNIFMQSSNLQLRRGSRVTTDATGNATGGNIVINTSVLANLEQSKITANAIQGEGGNIQIDTQGFFISPASTISASSQLGISGVVQIRTPDLNLQNSLTPIKISFIESNQIVAGSCLARRNAERGSFVITGTGGLPRSPYDPMTNGRYEVLEIGGQIGESDQRSAVSGQRSEEAESRKLIADSFLSPMPKNWQLGDRIQEAQALTSTTDGQIFLSINAQNQSVDPMQDLICKPK